MAASETDNSDAAGKAKLLIFGDDLNVFVETITREDTQQPQNA